MTALRAMCSEHVRKLVGFMLVGSAAFALAACDHLPLYNKEKDELAKSAQESYLKAEVTKVYAVQEENLKKLLEAEVDALKESAALRLDIALLRMADDHPVPDASTSLAAWYLRAEENEKALGFPDSAAVLAMLDHQIEVSRAEEAIQRHRNEINTADPQALPTLPGCDDVRGRDPSAQTWPYLSQSDNPFLPRIFANYVRQCQIVTQAIPADAGRVAAAFNELMQAQAELAERRVEAAEVAARMREAAEGVKEAQAEGVSAQTAVADATEVVKSQIDKAKSAADGLLDAVEELRALAGGEGAAEIAAANIRNISIILGAVGSGEIDMEGTADPRLVTAAAALQMHAPALAADMAELIDHARAPPVSNLILELQHQMIELGYANELIRLSERRIELLRARYKRLTEQAGAWRSFRLSLCNYAVLSGGGDHPGLACDNFKVAFEERENPTAENLILPICTLVTETLPGCALNQTWRQAHDAQQNSRVKREFWSAVYYYAEAVEAERAAREAEFRLVDIEHREVLAAQRSGIDAWSNLVEVPIGQLAAYHASGIQPEALAEAIATVLGFTALGVGVAQ